jgi:hypothetical protein
MSEPSKISKPRTLDLLGRIKGAASLTLRAVEFGFYHLLLTTVGRVSRLPRNTTMPEAARLYRENIALKAQLDALEAELAQRTEPAPTPMATRAAQVFAYLLTRGDEPFQRYFLSASLRTIRRWATRFRSLRRHPDTGGRPPLDEKVVEYRRYANTERPHQGIDGRTPEEFAATRPESEVIDLADVRKRRLQRRPYAHGILQGYALVADAPPAKAA